MMAAKLGINELVEEGGKLINDFYIEITEAKNYQDPLVDGDKIIIRIAVINRLKK
jgi:hypothetical protein